MYQPSHTSPSNDALLGFGISVPPGTAIHPVQTIFVEATLTKPGLTDVGSLVRACKSPQKGDMGIHGVLSGLPCIRFCMVAPQTPVIIVLPCNIVA